MLPSIIASDWEAVRAQFALTPEYLHLGASQFIASHPKSVREAIAHYRRLLDENPVPRTQALENAEMQKVREAAARYLGIAEPENIALTDSTTMGLGTIYSGLNLTPGQEVLTTVHDHYSQHEAIRLATRCSGGNYRKIELYDRLNHVAEEEIVGCPMREICPAIRAVGIT
ncbi:aminotransferase class V-fold PLP-dependent enzyme [Hymenobacter terrenus]|uniref:aminotransferase class V-fold PLP-dependent enzyme n=1 Tax=Hymenobacter terrenus TaxID=1629124 RepID=UPI0018CDFFAB|nr:aminotransferase class V-fold PLP-dependent enzyme [Hymenobacter terrenus]